MIRFSNLQYETIHVFQVMEVRAYIEVLITSLKFSFMKTNSFETALSDDPRTIYTFLKTKYENF